MDNGSSPATKKDLADLKTELKTELLDAIREANSQLKEELKEEVHKSAEDIETRLLRVFYANSDTTAKHMVGLDRSDGSFRERLMVLEDRLLELERHVNFPHFKP